MRWIILYGLLVNLAAFMAFGIDKRRAIRHQWRISERTLLLLAAAGGWIGALAGMYVFHHKTRHKKFVLGVPAIICVYILLAILYQYK